MTVALRSLFFFVSPLFTEFLRDNGSDQEPDTGGDGQQSSDLESAMRFRFGHKHRGGQKPNTDNNNEDPRACPSRGRTQPRGWWHEKLATVGLQKLSQFLRGRKLCQQFFLNLRAVPILR